MSSVPSLQKVESPDTETARPTILVVDDSRVIRKAIVQILGDEFEVLESINGEDGWVEITKNPDIQVVISDIEMPRIDGYGLLDLLRNFEDARIREMPVIIISGAEDEETRLKALDKGATDFIIKPLDRTQLLARTRAHAKFTETARNLEETANTLKAEATQDPLTKLSSRRFFVQRAEQDIAYSKRHNEDLAVIRLDIDKFRRLYKSHGDDAVDHILIAVAGILREQSRTEDTVARIGGSSFGILAPATSPEQAKVLADRVRASIAKNSIKWENEEIMLTASGGLVNISLYPNCDIDMLLHHAESQVRAARRAGGNQLIMGEGSQKESSTTEPANDESIDIEAVAVEEPENNVSQPGEGEEIELVPLDEDLELDAALQEMAMGTGSANLEELDANGLTQLLQDSLPMLDMCDKKLDLGIESALKLIRQKIKKLK